jgi:fructan beta-fructosidase
MDLIAMMRFRTVAQLGWIFFIGSAWSDDLIVADFEGDDFAGWELTGEAFGMGPATGAVGGQMVVDGYRGRGFVNGYHGGDDAVGRLVSPPFKIERTYLNFLIGGGGFAGETCVNLLLNGKVVRTATGSNTNPGGSERLAWETWDLTDLSGRSVVIEIVDSRKGTWGHVNVDHIVQSDVPAVLSIKREFPVGQRYLIWPVSFDTREKQRFFLTLDGEDRPLTFSDIALSNNPDFWVFTDLANYQGRTLTVTGRIPGELERAWKQVKLDETFFGKDLIYSEPLRPKYHFTSRRGWINDPNGLVWKDGIWHLFYQHNPYNHGWDNMHWGHATSEDLFHWEEHAPALFPNDEGYMYSGSGIVVRKDRTKLPLNSEEALVLAYTAEGTRSYVQGQKTVQSLAWSDNGGQTFKKFERNPVVPHLRAENRDPKIFWHSPSNHWVMALYYDANDYGIHVSPDLVKWAKASDYQIPGAGECPDLFELALDGDESDRRWVAWSANGIYLIGDFDGRKFTPTAEPQRHYFGNAYAGQTYDNAPDGRRVHLGWLRDSGPGLRGAPFNQQMTLPMDFSLRTVNGEPRLWIEPAEEVVGLRGETREWQDLAITSADPDPLHYFESEQFEIEAVIDLSSSASELGFRIFGAELAVWNRSDGSFTGIEIPVTPVDDKLRIRVFVDTVSLEVFVNGIYSGRYIRQTPGLRPARIVAEGGEVKFDSLRIHSLRSVW